ncbi:hypothetical protein D0T53_00260 [Dysgonomonas sp. 216]|uniref:hypothetical protein n=1 Tax=Dysgonomonas sp. 216 TaxID=2302934 RepID=UPI0013D78AA6|nr:hypothetical protein [Dysgonomonas sp. 216]NDW17346.1 hypothetical protein [Dysgonomonas sp. 216]
MDNYEEEDKRDDIDAGLAVLSYCLPIVGAVLYYINKDDYPEKSKMACISAIGGAVFIIALFVIITVIRRV